MDALDERAVAAANAGEVARAQRLREIRILLAYYAGLLPTEYGMAMGLDEEILFQEIVDGTDGPYAPNLENIRVEGHEYWVVTEICPASMNCTADEIANYLARYSVPGGDTTEPVQNNRSYPVHEPRPWLAWLGIGSGEVHVFISPDGLTVVNRSLPGHRYEDGQVVRSAVMSDDGTWYVITHGFGNNRRLDDENQWQGPQVFKYMDRQMQDVIERESEFVGVLPATTP
jgi:hypothetical protein